jgi:hypothetical protein
MLALLATSVQRHLRQARYIDVDVTAEERRRAALVGNVREHNPRHYEYLAVLAMQYFGATTEMRSASSLALDALRYWTA